MKWFKKAAALGNPIDTNNIGYIYEQRNDNEMALEWYAKAAESGDTIERGDVEAMHNLGDLYFENEYEKMRKNITGRRRILGMFRRRLILGE